MRRLVALMVAPVLAFSIAVQPVSANHNEAVGWVDFWRGSTPLASFYALSTCTTTSCVVNVAVSRPYYGRAMTWGCTSVTYTIPANTVYDQDHWRTLAGRCVDPKQPNSYVLFYVRIDALIAGNTTWVTHDAPVTVKINVVSR